MATDFGDLPAAILEEFEAAYPASDDPGVLAEIAALEKLFGREMPDEILRLIELERHQALSPTPRELIEQEHPFEALILRAQEMNDCVPLLFPLTGSVYLRRFDGWADLVGYVGVAPARPLMPFVSWRRDAWAYDVPSFLRVAAARSALENGDVGKIEELIAPVWGRIGTNEYLEELFYFLEDEGIDARLNQAWGERPMLRPQLAQWWRHERALFFGFAFVGKYRQPEKGAFDYDPEPVLANPQLLRNLGGQLGSLCRAWFFESEDFLTRALAATAESKSVLVQDARRLFTELRDGRRSVGTADLHHARDTYKEWVKDPAVYFRHKRELRRAELEALLKPSEHGIELVRADWPLAAEVAAAPMPPGRSVTWNGHAMELVVDGVSRTLPKPPAEMILHISDYQPKSALSPSGRKLVVDATQNRPTADGRSRENVQVLAEFDLESETWRVLTGAKDGQWYAAIDEDRWVYRDAKTAYLLRDTGETFADATYTAVFGQPKSFCIPELGVLFAYGAIDLANGRPTDERGAPWVRIIGFWRDRLAEMAAFPIDAQDIVAEQVDGKWRVGLISADRAVAWEVRGLEAGAKAWQEQSQAAEAAERAKREAFGEVTAHNCIAALNTFTGTKYGPEIQEGVSKVFEQMLANLRADPATVSAAQEATNAVDFVEHVKGPFSRGLMEAGLGPIFTDFALHATILNPTIADVVVRAATTTAWKGLREG